VRLKPSADQALADAPTVESVAVLRRIGTDVAMAEGRDHWWHELVAAQPDDPASCPCEEGDGRRGPALGRTPVVDTWWQTETGMIMITPFPGSRHPSQGR
jgi:acyl-coenzyme A synthetase/AMP-(fatty) acid ligase